MVMVEEVFIIPASFAQQRLWFLDCLEQGSPLYNVPIAMRLEGRLDADALARCFNEIISRHETLRTTLSEQDGELVQVIVPALTLELPVIDLQHLGADARERQARELAIEEARRGFDLQAGPLLRVSLLRLGEQEHVLLATMHHIISDAWSMGVLVREVATLYEAFTGGLPSPLTELPIQYADYAIWQREWLQGEVLETHLDYWRRQLAGALPVLELPTDRPRPAVRSFRGARLPVSFSDELSGELRRLSGREGATLFMTLLAAWQALLSRYSGAQDISVGTPVAGRTQEETKNLIGFFVNTLVMRTLLDGNPTFRELLARVRRSALGAFDHQEVPFEKLVETLQPARSLSHAPLFQVMFSLNNVPRGEFQLRGLKWEQLEAGSGTAKFDLTLSLEEQGERITGALEYDTDLFDDATAAQISKHFNRLLQAVVANPETRLAELPLLSEDEERRMLRDWNETARPYPLSKQLHELFEEQVARTPDAVAVVSDDGQLSYAELNAKADELARFLRARGVASGACVGMCLERSLEMVWGMLGVLKAGGAYVPLDPEYPRERLRFMWRDAGASVLLTQQKLLADNWWPQEAAVVCLDAAEEALAQSSAMNTPDSGQVATGGSSAGLAYIIYTSGSTGRPKGVMVSHRAICNHLLWRQERYPLNADDSFLHKASFSFDISVWELFAPLVAGARLVLAAPGGQQDSVYLVRTISAQGITFVHFGPSMLDVIVREPEFENCHSLRHVFCGGETMTADLQERFFARSAASLHHQYGPTETTVDVAIYDCERETKLPAVPIGRPIANTQVYLLDTQLKPVPVGVAGELYVGGEGLARGYLGDAGLTAERFVPHPFSDAGGARLYRTGDVGRYLPGGDILFIGRADQQIKLRGFRIEPAEIEAALRQHQYVAEATLVAREDRPGGKILVAYLVPLRGMELNAAELRNWLRERLPEYMLPAAYVMLDAMPLTATGKIDRQALPAPSERTQESAEDFATARSTTEEIVAGIWTQLLGLQEIGLHDNFFDLRGHSLLATQVISRVRQVLGIEIPLRSIFEAPTVASFASRIESAMHEEGETLSPPLVPVARDERTSLSYAQQRLWFLDQLEPGSPFYNLPAAVRLTGRLDIEALERSLREIVRRHEILRTVFTDLDGRPSQIVHASHDLSLPVTDLSGLAENVRHAEAMRLTTEEAQALFDLTRAPLLRARLLRLAADEHILLITMHHIVSDGWSLGVFIRELTTLYNASTEGRPALLPELPIQYADYALWQQQRMRHGAYENDLAYWRQHLTGAPTALSLPGDHPRPPVQFHRGALYNFAIPAALAAELRALSRQQGVTLFMTLLAGFNALLSRYTGETDIVVGTPIAGRNRSETEGLIGFFVNMLALRTDVSGDPAVTEMLGRVREVCLGGYAHQEVPFERLVEELQVERSLSHAPLFQVMFSLNNAPREKFELPGLDVSLMEAQGGTAKFDLSLSLTEHEAGLRGVVEYSTDIYEEQTVERMMRHYAHLLEAFVADPVRPLSTLELLEPRERQLLLEEWNATQVAYPQERCLHELFEQQAARTPHAVALVYEQEELSYRELDERANRLAHYLRQRGVRAESRVGVLMERSLEMVVGLLGVLKAGGAYVPLDGRYPAERLRQMVEDAGVEVVLRHGERGGAEEEAEEEYGAREIWVEEESELIGGESAAGVGRVSEAENAAYVIYTSGSTGKPKGVVVSHRNVANFFAGMDEVIGNKEPGVWLALTSISFDISVLELFWTLARGFKVVIQDDEQLPSQVAVAAQSAVTQKTVDFSLFYFASDEHKNNGDIYRLLIEGAKFADRHNFSAVWTPERHFHAFGGLYPNPSVTSAALATITERIQIRAGSVVLPLHDPVRVAEEWSVVDNLSKGRVAISFASGWHANDFVFAPDVYNNRHATMYQHIETVRKLWRGESIRRRGGAGNEIEVRITPRPVQPELPFWVTAAGNPQTFETAGRIGANLLTHLLGQSVEELEKKIHLYRAAWREHGHPHGEGRVAVMLHAFVEKDMALVREKVRTPFTNYLRSSISLIKTMAESLGMDANAKDLSEEDMNAILAHAFDRYFETSSLMGTPQSCLRMIERLKAAGVDEAACLIDFGVEHDEVLSALRHLNELRERSNAPVERYPEDYSIAAQIKRHGVTHMQCTPSMARMLVHDSAALDAMRSLSKLFLGGEALPTPLAQQLRAELPAKIHNMYGPTETTIWSSTHAIEETGNGVPIGKPIANTALYILDAYLQPVPIGAPGDLYIAGEGVVRGYLNRPDLTAARFIPNPFSREAGARMYDTGDVARYLPGGVIEFIGRNDRQVKIRGHRIELAEIETALARHEAISEAVVVARADATGEARLFAYLVPAEPQAESPARQPLSADEAARVLGGRPHFKLPNGMSVAHLSGFRTNIVYREIFEDEVYLKHGITLEDGACIFDVGANIGLFTLFAHQRARNVNVYAFEPIPPTFDVLSANAALHNLNVKLFNCGVSDTNQDAATFTFYPQMPGLSGRYADREEDKRITRSIITDWLDTDAHTGAKTVVSDQDLDQLMEEQFKSETFACRLVTLSEVMREHGVERIDLLKVDVEKSEFDVLSGIEPEDWPKIRQIVMEVDTPELLDKILTLLNSKGYEISVDEVVSVKEQGEEAGVNVFMLYAAQQEVAAERAARSDVKTGEPATADAKTLEAPALRAYLKELLPDYMVPSGFILLKELPLTPNGKVNRNALPETASLLTGADEAYVAPETQAEQIIADIWRETLKLERVGVNDSFFEVGGTSLLIVQVNSKMRTAFNKTIPIVEMFRHPTVGALAAYVERAETDKPSFERAQSRADKQAEALNLRKQAGQNRQAARPKNRKRPNDKKGA
jgi:natural product biosynthesis luciferase-like monooxygenase protein/amino acid adenylation domain-containing protein/FkbM family methyltransferase